MATDRGHCCYGTVHLLVHSENGLQKYLVNNWPFLLMSATRNMLQYAFSSEWSMILVSYHCRMTNCLSGLFLNTVLSERICPIAHKPWSALQHLPSRQWCSRGQDPSFKSSQKKSIAVFRRSAYRTKAVWLVIVSCSFSYINACVYADTE